MSNFIIIWTVLISIFYLGTRYQTEHYLGCALILMSGLVSVVVNLQTRDPPLGEYKAPGGSFQQSSGLWYMIFIIGTVPSGVSNCYKQRCLKSVDLEVMYASFWSGNWQIMGLLTFPSIGSPRRRPPPNTCPAKRPSLSRARGRASGVRYRRTTGAPFIPPTNTPPSSLMCATRAWSRMRMNRRRGATAGGSAAVWYMNIAFNVSFNVLLLWLTKRMSGTWAQIGTVLCLDLASVFSIHVPDGKR